MRPIIFIDSGVGGLPYLDWVRKKLPDENLVYVADNANFPYGEKSVEEIRKALVFTVKTLIDSLNPRFIVIACNTASVTTLSTLRKLYKIPFVGVVPAVKTAAEKYPGRTIGILATSRTVENKYLDDLIKRFASDCNIVRHSEKYLVDFIENKHLFSSRDERRNVIKNAVEKFKAMNISSLILGCTHFVFLEEDFKREFGNDIEVVDSREGVAKQIYRILEKEGSNSIKKDSGSFFYITKKVNEENYRKFAEKYGLIFMGCIIEK